MVVCRRHVQRLNCVGVDVGVQGNYCVSPGCDGAVCGCDVSDAAWVVVTLSGCKCVWKVVLFVLIVVHPLPWCLW